MTGSGQPAPKGGGSFSVEASAESCPASLELHFRFAPTADLQRPVLPFRVLAH
jgi:hypothetical protein